MRNSLTAAAVAACLTFGFARAAEPKLPATASQPVVVLASAADADGKVSLTLRLLDVAPAAENRTITVYETVAKQVDGQIVTEKVPVTKTIAVMVMKPTRWREVKLTIGDGIEVRDVAGKEVAATKLSKLLEKDTPVLLSTAGPVDPFYLQTAKEGTLVVLAPPEKVMMGPIGNGAAPALVPAPIGLPGRPVPTPPPMVLPPIPPKELPKDPTKQ